MATVVGVRPNIRIEIQNNVSEPMEVDNEEKEADVEDGEISDKNDSFETDVVENTTALTTNKPLTSATHLSIFRKKEHMELSDDVDALKQSEINNFPEDEMPKLFTSLGITPENEDNVRFESLHAKGLENMILDDIFKYFCNYEPTFVEWISSGCCNVIFQDNITAAKALYFTSKAIKVNSNDPKTDPSLTTTGKSILLVNKEREVELEGEDMVVLSNNDDDSVNISDIPVPIPEGYWRLGTEHPKAKYIFLRFTLKTDKKNARLERRTSNFGDPACGGVIGLISESRKQKIKGIFDRNKEIHGKPDDSTKNPWGDLAENWYTNESIEEPPPLLLKPVVKREVLECQKYDVLNRLGTKRSIDDDDKNGSDQENKKKSKVPRMRMYADEEEAKIKRKKRLLAVKMFTINTDDTTKVVPDLRNIIRTATKVKTESEESDYHSDNSDLGKKLKNRLKKRNYRNSQSKPEHEQPALLIKEEPRFQPIRTERQRDEDRKARENDRHIRERERQLDNFRNKSPPPPQKHIESRQKKELPLPHHKSRDVKHDYNKSRYKNKMHSDNHDERHKKRRRSRSKGDFSTSKTKSKVAVVVKKPKKPVVASTVWSRIDNSKKERLKTASERLKGAKDSSSSSESSSDSSSSTSTTSSTNNSSSESSSESEDTNDEVVEQAAQAMLKGMDRPGFKTSSTQSIPVDHYKKSPLRIEISNDHFRN